MTELDRLEFERLERKCERNFLLIEKLTLTLESVTQTLKSVYRIVNDDGKDV